MYSFYSLFDEITVHGHVKITFNSILSYVIALGVCLISFSPFHISHIHCNLKFMVEHMMLFKFPSRHHMVFGILCTLTVLMFEQHRAQLRFRPRTSTCFRQCQVLVSRKMSFLIHFDFSLLSCIFFYSLSDEITVHGYVKIPFNYDWAHAQPLGVSQDYLSNSLEHLSACK